MDAIRGKNDVFNLIFKCRLCTNEKILKASSRCPTSNLKTHANHCHPEISGEFLSSRNKSSTSATEVSIEKIWN